jgi:hypothetical protein
LYTAGYLRSADLWNALTAEENLLPLVLTVVDIDTELGGKYFRFKYGNGEYEINNNGCTCSGMSSGLEGATGCRCAFHLMGT